MTATRNTKAPRRARGSRENTGSASKAENKPKRAPPRVGLGALDAIAPNPARRPRREAACSRCGGAKLRIELDADGRCAKCAHESKLCSCGAPAILVTRAWVSPICVRCAALVTATVGSLLLEDPRQLRLFP